MNRIPEAIIHALACLKGFGIEVRERIAGADIVSDGTSIAAYESGRPSDADACRSADTRFLHPDKAGEEAAPCV